MLTIGELARYLGVSVRMLRHYDSLGLLEPAHVDDRTGYRSYAARQLPRANRLIALNDLGIPLSQLGPVLDHEVGAAELHGMLALRRAEIGARIEQDRARLAAIEARLRTITQEETMSQLEFVTKPLPAVRLAQGRTHVGSQAEIGPAFGPLIGQVTAALGAAGAVPAGPVVAWYVVGEDGVEVAAGFPTTRDTVPGVEVVDLPTVDRALTVIHQGPTETIGDTWQALVTQVEARGLSPAGPGREVYLETPYDDPAAWVTELQQPVG